MQLQRHLSSSLSFFLHQVKMFGVWLDPDVAGRQAGKSVVVGDNGDDATPLTPEEEAVEEGALFFTEGVKVWPCC